MICSKNNPDEYIDSIEENENHPRMDRNFFKKEICYIAKSYHVTERDVEIDIHHPVGEYCIFVKGHWYGYLDDMFYEAMARHITPIELDKENEDFYRSLDEKKQG